MTGLLLPVLSRAARILVCGFSLILALPVAAGLIETVPHIKESVVAVGTYQQTRSPPFRFLGTGFAVGNGRLIATNAHVIPDVVSEDQFEMLVVVLPGDEQTRGVRRVARVAVDPERDLAVLRLDAGNSLPPLTLSGNGGAQEGQSIAFTGFPIGNALGMTPVTHRGIISALTPIGIPQGNARDLNPALVRRLAGGAFRVYQLDATAYPGNSGSPVFDPDSGEVLGVVNMVFVKTTKENILSSPSGISYAIPVKYLANLIEGLN